MSNGWCFVCFGERYRLRRERTFFVLPSGSSCLQSRIGCEPSAPTSERCRAAPDERIWNSCGDKQASACDTYIGENGPAPRNILNRDISGASASHVMRLTDITAFLRLARMVHFSPTIDCFNGVVVSWSIGSRPNAALVNTILDAAFTKIAVLLAPRSPIEHCNSLGVAFNRPEFSTATSLDSGVKEVRVFRSAGAGHTHASAFC